MKLLANRVSQAVTKRQPFKLGPHAIFGPAPEWQQRLQKRWREFVEDTDFPTAIGLLGLCLALTVAWKLLLPTVLPDLWPEMGGMVLDVFFILIVFAIFEQRRLRRTEIQRQHEIVDDYKRWDAEEARARIVGAIRRLNRMDVFAIDFRGAVLSDLSFASAGVRSLSKSVFYDGEWGEPHQVTRVSLRRVAFDNIDCRDVQFSPFDPFEALAPTLGRYAQLEDCSFISADLRGALFNGAQMAWTAAPPPSLYEESGEFDEQHGRAQIHYGPFHDADLAGASFRGAVLRNADFRGANNVEAADFFRATGVEDALFGSAQEKAAALTSANRDEAEDEAA